MYIVEAFTWLKFKVEGTLRSNRFLLHNTLQCGVFHYTIASSDIHTHAYTEKKNPMP